MGGGVGRQDEKVVNQGREEVVGWLGLGGVGGDAFMEENRSCPMRDDE